MWRILSHQWDETFTYLWVSNMHPLHTIRYSQLLSDFKLLRSSTSISMFSLVHPPIPLISAKLALANKICSADPPALCCWGRVENYVCDSSLTVVFMTSCSALWPTLSRCPSDMTLVAPASLSVSLYLWLSISLCLLAPSLSLICSWYRRSLGTSTRIQW